MRLEYSTRRHRVASTKSYFVRACGCDRSCIYRGHYAASINHYVIALMAYLGHDTQPAADQQPMDGGDKAPDRPHGREPVRQTSPVQAPSSQLLRVPSRWQSVELLRGSYRHRVRWLLYWSPTAGGSLYFAVQALSLLIG